MINHRYAIYMLLPTNITVRSYLVVTIGFDGLEVCFSPTKYGKTVMWKLGWLGNRVSRGRFSDSCKMESQILSHSKMMVFLEEKRRAGGKLFVTCVRMASL